jgi:hypothetical protein
MTVQERTAFLGELASPDAEDDKIGVINPFALAETIIGRPIDWSKVEDKRRFLETTLETPYAELFDPVHKGPLYAGLGLDDKMRLVREKPAYVDRKITVPINDLELSAPDSMPRDIRKLSDLRSKMAIADLDGVEVKSARMGMGNTLTLTLSLQEADADMRLARLFDEGLARTVLSFANPTEASTPPDWTPPNADWRDDGRFFNEAAEFFDPIQGSVANCYFIAAMASVAWAQPYMIQQMSRATSGNQQSFTNLVRFYTPNSGGVVSDEIEVTDQLPRRSNSGNPIYCRSSEAGEIWPGVYEKAFAKLETGHTGDKPEIPATAWGNAGRATAQLTGGTRQNWRTRDVSADDLWDAVRSYSRGGRTFMPMTCHTYSTGAAADQDIDYADANIVASHAYSVLGWAFRNGTKYIVLRNPWGSTEGTVGALNDIVWMRDIDWWRPIVLTNNDGVFAIEAGAFKTYFSWLFGVSTPTAPALTS